MKTTYKILGILVLALAAGGFHSCEKLEQPVDATGTFELSVSFEETGLKSDGVPDSLGFSRFHALLTILGPDSLPVMEDELLPLYKFGDAFWSEKIELKRGHYFLMKFMIVNPEGEVIFAAPLRGSPKAYLVKKPLPIGFNIKPDETTRLSPEVLPVHGEPPSEFGYSTFSFSVVKPLPFFIGVVIDNPMIMDPTTSAVAPSRFTEAALSVYHPDGWHHDFWLQAKVNRVVIRGGAKYYKFIIEKKGFEPVRMEIPAEKLMATSQDNPLIVKIGPEMFKLVLQPDPDHGIDAMVTTADPDGNFGKHPFFEAMWRSDSLLTVMNESRSLIRFRPTGLPKSAIIKKVTLTLFYRVPVPWPLDTVFATANTQIYDTVYPDIVKYGAVLQQIVEPWEEHEVTWDKQPKTIEANQVYIRPFVINANFISIDVTRMYVPLQEIAAPNYGMMLRLVDKNQFPGFRFLSSDINEDRMRPMLTIYYSLPSW